MSATNLGMLVHSTRDRDCAHVQQIDKVGEAAKLGIPGPCDLHVADE